MIAAVEFLLDARDDVGAAKHLIVGIFMAAQAPTLPVNERRALCAVADAAREKLEAAEIALDRIIAEQRQR